MASPGRNELTLIMTVLSCLILAKTLNQWWPIVNYNPRNKHSGIYNPNTKISLMKISPAKCKPFNSHVNLFNISLRHTKLANLYLCEKYAPLRCVWTFCQTAPGIGVTINVTSFSTNINALSRKTKHCSLIYSYLPNSLKVVSNLIE